MKRIVEKIKEMFYNPFAFELEIGIGWILIISFAITCLILKYGK